MRGFTRSNGKVLCFFSASVGVQSPITAEVLEIAKAIELCITKQKVRDKEIIFESDSKTLVSWINGGGLGSTDHVQSVFGIGNNLNILSRACVVFKSRVFNSVADSLAKNGE
ncbi:hypothetical protein Dsin_029958 [Dipteronia sinensis]|uniref:RNase H type-1 domain-containing protein n=1 Tax=Dipteronia sinensis TaxID=43782 RepID=A0AAE0DQQ5_9ROSI|nr:hypothetical protein Dsin_029958 [Dipteronia sinensis]